MSEMKEYKCPSCDASIEFDSSSQQMKCPYCSSIYDISVFEEKEMDDKKIDGHWDFSVGKQWEDTEKNNMSEYECVSCGGKVVVDKNTSATSCPFCENNIILTEKLSNDLKPDYIIPFKIDKKTSKNSLLKYSSKYKLVPKIFKDENHIDEIKGIYVPFWLFDAQVDAQAKYRAEHIHFWSDSRYEYKAVEMYDVYRRGIIDFHKVPVNATTSIDSKLTQAIEPFYFDDAVEFKMPYLSGYMANKYDIDAKDSKINVDSRISQSCEFKISNTIPYESITQVDKNINVLDVSSKYALYPVWILNTSWNNDKYVFAVNGQTGKIVGDLPIDYGIYRKNIFIYAMIITLILFVVECFTLF